MIRPILYISASALVLSLATIAGALAIGKADLAAHGNKWTLIHKGTLINIVPDDGTRRAIAQQIAFDGKDSLVNALPYDVEYRTGTASTVDIKGPKSIIDRIHLDKGVLSLSPGADHPGVVTVRLTGHSIESDDDSDEMHIIVTAPAVSKFENRGSGRLDIKAFDGARLKLDLTGSGGVSVTGKAEDIVLNLPGSGSADLGELVARAAQVDLAGSGGAEIAPLKRADIHISGSGTVSLKTRPAEIHTEISGSGHVENEDEN